MIKFPKVHIATSVVNRILNIADGIPTPGAASVAVPDVPDSIAQSTALNQKLAEPLQALPGIDKTPDPGATVSGRPLLDTLLQPEQ